MECDCYQSEYNVYPEHYPAHCMISNIILSDIKEGEISKDCKLTDYVDVVEELECIKCYLEVSNYLETYSYSENLDMITTLITKLKGNSTESKNSIVCPYCGSKDVDIGHLLEDNGKKLCFKCKKTYNYEAVKLTEEGSYWKTFKLKGE
jgi:Zn finger protein HypA/HybF involved in hydrogenase expression